LPIASNVNICQNLPIEKIIHLIFNSIVKKIILKRRIKMKGFIFIAIVLLLVPIGISASDWEFEYYIPHVVSYPEFYSGNHGYTKLTIIIPEDGTDFEIDQDGDGIYESQFSNLLAGELHHFVRTNWPCNCGDLATGSSVRSNTQLQLILKIGINDFGTYDEGLLYTAIIPTYLWGNNFVVPVASTYLYFFAKTDTDVLISPPGEAPVTHSIGARTNLKLANIDPGTRVSASNSIYVLALNCQTDQNYPWMYNVLPLSMLGDEYYHDSSYGELDISVPCPTDPKLWITAVNNSTSVEIDENNDGNSEYSFNLNDGESSAYSNPIQGSHITSDQDIYVVYVENWTAAPRGRYGGVATEYLPTKLYGKNYALLDANSARDLPEYNPRIFTVAAENNTNIDLDFSWNGVDDSNTINQGEIWTVLWPQGIGAAANLKSNKGIQVIYRTDSSHPDPPGVNIAYTAYSLDLYKIIEINLTINPDTLNKKSKGKWITTYIDLPEGYDVTDIDISTVNLEYDSQAINAEWGDVQGDLLMVKFSRPNLIDILGDITGDVELKVKGQVEGKPFEGTDTIRVK
jgi:hypothetical protein